MIRLNPEGGIVPSTWKILENMQIYSTFDSGPLLWRLSTKIIEKEDLGNHFSVKTESGSTYILYKDRETNGSDG